VGITTKSDLIVRDIPLLQEVARGNQLNVNLTITTLDEKLARVLEPRAPRPELRLRAMERLAEAGISVGAFANPAMPWITDGEVPLDRLARAVKAAGGRHFGAGPLFLMPSTQSVFLPFLAEHMPRLVPRYKALYAHGAFLGKGYKDELRDRVRRIRDRHNLAAQPVEYTPELWEEHDQPSLFSLQ
jgi:DNA repair photolyase